MPKKFIDNFNTHVERWFNGSNYFRATYINYRNIFCTKSYHAKVPFDIV